MNKKFILIFILFLSSFSAFAQKKLEIYTKLKEAAFIPYINDEQMTMIPVDTFSYSFDTATIVHLTIHFPDSTIYDISKKLNYNGLKYKKFQIVKRKKIIQKLTDIKQRHKADTLKASFMLKDESFGEYLHRTF
jgi:hypothetical protein